MFKLYNNNLKKERGITLISLVITIIVLLILAGITLSHLFDKNGVVVQAGESKQKTERAYIIELGQVDITADQSKNKDKRIRKTQLIDVLDKYFVGVEEIADSENILDEVLMSKGEYGTYEIKVSEIYNGPFLTDKDKNKFDPDELDTEEKSIFNYVVNGDKVEIIGFNFFNLEHEAVDKIEMYGYDGVGIRVLNHEYLEIPTQIEGKTVTKVSFGNSIGELGESYYKAILGITTIEYPETCEVLGKQVSSFADVKTLVLNEGLKELQDEAFYGWVELENVTIPSTVETISGQPFYRCMELEDKTVKVIGKKSSEEFKKVSWNWDFIGYLGSFRVEFES